LGLGGAVRFLGSVFRGARSSALRLRHAEPPRGIRPSSGDARGSLTGARGAASEIMRTASPDTSTRRSGTGRRSKNSDRSVAAMIGCMEERFPHLHSRAIRGTTPRSHRTGLARAARRCAARSR
jgi:hypothetical protein